MDEKMGVTRDEILAMKPGRELDAMVAEKVLGYKLHWAKPNIRGSSGNIGGTLEWLPCEPYEHGAQRLREDGRGPNEYSKTGPAVWDVIERMAGDGWAFTFFVGPLARCWTEFRRGTKQVMAVYDDGPETICKAALLAMEDTPLG